MSISKLLGYIKEARERSMKKTADHAVRAELVADNLIANNIFPPEARASVVESLKDHGKTLLLLDKVAQAVSPSTLGSPVKMGTGHRSSDDFIRESDRAFVEAAFLHR